MRYLDDLSKLISTTSLNKEHLIKTGAKPTKVALWVSKGSLQVCGVYWEGYDGKRNYGVWDDENSVSMTDIILDLPRVQSGTKYAKKSNEKVIMLVINVVDNKVYYHEENFLSIKERTIEDFLDNFKIITQ